MSQLVENLNANSSHDLNNVVHLKEKVPFSFGGKFITAKKAMTPLKIIVYGYNGVGKSTFASEAKNPIFMDLEGNVDHLEVPKQPISSLIDVVEFLKCLLEQSHDYNTLVIDSLDSLGLLVTEYVTKTYSKADLAFGKDSVKSIEKCREIVALLDRLRKEKKMHIIFTAHSCVKRCENPLTETFDKYELKLNEKMASIFCNWVHCILFAVNDVFFEAEKGKQGGKQKAKNIMKRSMYTMGNTAYVAKNVFDLPSKMDFKWEEFKQHVMKFFEN